MVKLIEIVLKGLSNSIQNADSITAMLILLIGFTFGYGHLNYASQADISDVSKQITTLSIKMDINYYKNKRNEIKKEINEINKLSENEITVRDVDRLGYLNRQLKKNEKTIEKLNDYLLEINPKYELP